MERVAMVVHPTRDVLDAVGVVDGWAREHGLELVQLRAGEQPEVAPPGEVSTCDLVVAIGGDGTILKALHASTGSHTPVLGVAYGSLGALTAVAADELHVGLDRFAAGEWQARELPALAVRADGAQIASAINDLVLTRGKGTQLLVDLRVRQDLYARLAGDGVALATPLGSSAYSMAAGGSLLTEGLHAFICTPLAMHGGCAPPLVVGGEEEVIVEIHPGHGGFDVSVDGFSLDSREQHFAVTLQAAYATLVVLADSPSSLTRLRARGLISDSPRVIGQDRLAKQMAAG